MSIIVSSTAKKMIVNVPFKACRLLGGDIDTEPNLRPARFPKGFESELQVSYHYYRENTIIDQKNIEHFVMG